ncbi:MAG: TetR family transcriptional regulator [Bifidobacterium mongoliense]|uniref:TetR/AcrR family transcriptional regulator n=2 Tax=Bifidobacterium mongoliense TaxID=518643 RepID=UPI002F351FED
MTPTASATTNPHAPLGTRAERTRAASDRKILQAMLDIIASQGIGAVSIEEVSRRSGIAKTTIYRRYRNTEDMLRGMHAFQLTDTDELDDLEPSLDNFALLLERLIARFSSEIGIKAVGVLLSSGNAHLNRLVQQAVRPERDRIAAFLKRGTQAGLLRRGLDIRFLFNTIIGSMVACATFPTKLPPSTTPATASAPAPDEERAGRDWATQLAHLLWPAIAV